VLNLRRFMALATLLAAFAGAAIPAEARSPFDGRWRVVIRSAIGNCDAAGSYPLIIRNGLVAYRGIVPVVIRGRVDRQGRVALRLDGGSRWARAAGKLSKFAGAGTWRGRWRRHACAGRWWAQRR